MKSNLEHVQIYSLSWCTLTSAYSISAVLDPSTQLFHEEQLVPVCYGLLIPLRFAVEMSIIGNVGNAAAWLSHHLDGVGV